MKLSEAPTIHESAVVVASSLGRWTEVQARCRLNEVRLGDYSYISEGSQADHATIGKFANIAAYTRIGATNHPMWRASQHHFVYRAGDYFEGETNETAFFDWRRSNGPKLGHDVWLGHGAIVLPGVTIGDGAVVGAGAVVSRSVPAYQIAVGAPARVVKARFSPNIAERMAALAWWDWPHDTLRRALPDFRALSAEAFLEKHEGASP
ncbi:MAG: DapH/DapD/GlmU-related protein [Pseudomonadota bacterium]